MRVEEWEEESRRMVGMGRRVEGWGGVERWGGVRKGGEESEGCGGEEGREEERGRNGWCTYTLPSWMWCLGAISPVSGLSSLEKGMLIAPIM